MKVLVVGRGGREHSVIMHLAKSKQVSHIYAAPGNGGLEELATCVDIDEIDIQGLIKVAKETGIDLTIVGTEIRLNAGIADAFEKENLKVFAPRKNAAILEGSKDFAKQFMDRHAIPTAKYQTFTDADEAKARSEERRVGK